ncbi:MAG: hypothetical protein J6S40_02000 [Thermoguttaceae bacterium]|nr:hypothetical protein [Thermoguttaceae bacterium]
MTRTDPVFRRVALLGVFFFLLAASGFHPLRADEVLDGLPFFLEKEHEPIDRLRARLESEPPTDPISVGFIPLSRQSRAYRGRWVHIEGRLLRVAEITLPAEKEDGLNLETYYESWVLLDDERKIPIRLLSFSLPPGIVPSETDAPLRRERIAADGIFYRIASYNAGDDFYNSPIVAAPGFALLTPIAAVGETSPSSGAWRWKGIALAALFALWILVRFFLLPRRKRRRNERLRRVLSKDDDEPFDPAQLDALKDLPVPTLPTDAESTGDDAPPATKTTLSLLFVALLLSAGTAAADDPSAVSIDCAFWKEVTPIETDLLFAAESEDAPAFAESLQIILTRLKSGVSPGLLARALPADGDPFDAFPENFGVPVRVEGEVTAVAPVRLEARADFPPLDTWRVELGKNDPPLILRTASIPKGWGSDGSKGIGRKCSGLGIFFEKFTVPIVALSRLEWLDAPTPLGAMGFDVSLFDTIEAHAIGELSSLPDGEKRRGILRNFRLTPDDRYPFYGLLAGTVRASGKPIPSGPDPPAVVDLFNRPASFQGVPVTLTGHLRRAQPVLVSDGEIVSLYGIDHYYELCLFTNDSQDYPIIFCTTELPADPDGRPLPLGSGTGYREEVTLTGFLYKPWAYRIDPSNSGLQPALSDTDSDEGKSWIAVPLMIGLRGSWNSDASPTEKWDSPFSPKIYPVLGGVIFLVILYLMLRRRSKPLRFHVGGGPENP